MAFSLVEILDLDFWQFSNQTYKKLKHKKKFFGKCQTLPRFPRRMALSLSTKFCIFKPGTKIHTLLGVSKEFKQVYWKLKYDEKFLRKLLGLSGSPEKIVLYSSSKFGSFEPYTNIQSVRRFYLGFWQTSKLMYRKFQYWEKVFGNFQGFLCFSRKLVLCLSTKFGNF